MSFVNNNQLICTVKHTGSSLCKQRKTYYGDDLTSRADHLYCGIDDIFAIYLSCLLGPPTIPIYTYDQKLWNGMFLLNLNKIPVTFYNSNRDNGIRHNVSIKPIRQYLNDLNTYSQQLKVSNTYDARSNIQYVRDVNGSIVYAQQGRPLCEFLIENPTEPRYRGGFPFLNDKKYHGILDGLSLLQGSISIENYRQMINNELKHIINNFKDTYKQIPNLKFLMILRMTIFECEIITSPEDLIKIVENVMKKVLPWANIDVLYIHTILPMQNTIKDNDVIVIDDSTDIKTQWGDLPHNNEDINWDVETNRIPSYDDSSGGSKKIKRTRKHKAIHQSGGNKGRLKKGYRYSGKRTKSGLPVIVKSKSNKK